MGKTRNNRGRADRGVADAPEVEVEDTGVEETSAAEVENDPMRNPCLDQALPSALAERFRAVFPFAPDDVILRAAIESAMVHITTFRKIGDAAALAWEQNNPDALQAAVDNAHQQARAAGQR